MGATKALLNPTKIVLLAILIVSSALMVRNMSQPWNGLDGGDGALFSKIAKNYLEHGIWELKFGQAYNYLPGQDKDSLKYYQHHPPLLPLLIAGSFAVFGENEAAARLVPILFSLASIVLLYKISKQSYGENVAITATFIFASFPAILFFARKPGYEPLSLFFILLSLYYYNLIRDMYGKKGYIAFFLAMGAGLLTDWPVYFLLSILCLHFFISQKGTKRIVFPTILMCYGLIIFLVFECFSYLVDPKSFTDLVNQGLVYMGVIDLDHELANRYEEVKVTFTPSLYTKRLLSRLDLLYTYPLVIVSVVGFVWFLGKKRLLKSNVIILLSVAATYCIVFYRSVYIHYWHTYFFAAPFAVLSAIFISSTILGNDIGHKNEKFTPLVKWIHPLAVFFFLLVIGGSLPRLIDLHTLQEKVLPDEQHEHAMLIKSLSLKIKELSSPNDIIITNLAEGPKTPLTYYAERNIIFESDFDKGYNNFKKSKSHKMVWWIEKEGSLFEFPPNTRHSRFNLYGQNFVLLSHM
ncbi:ArnT family glycosyltransferase [Methylomarinum vadi]|uniref:ArnT family glycosyltransferase n=1 Tax=Methylomarinum vadi TaxID=438855 RepID=UPI0004DF20DF|nr:glycosyltransferase family 39 protein [Methylomarinum vadi]